MEDLVKGGLSLLVYFLIYFLFMRKTKKRAPQPPAIPKRVPLPVVAKELAKVEKKPVPLPPKGLSDRIETNPLYFPAAPKSRVRSLIRGQSKRNAILLSEILKKPS